MNKRFYTPYNAPRMMRRNPRSLKVGDANRFDKNNWIVIEHNPDGLEFASKKIANHKPDYQDYLRIKSKKNKGRGQIIRGPYKNTRKGKENA